MLKNYIISSNPVFLQRFYCVKTSTEKVKSFKNTVFLPKTKFPNYLSSKQVVERDEKIQQEAKFSELYNWQRENLKGEYVLHDGPPYANGKPHIGHAVNKILKDIILRSQIVQGKRVHFVPGWDCHGLPIELAALKNVKEEMSVQEIRKRARNVALEMSAFQKEKFKEWGVLGDWENQCYYTMDPKYIVNQLKIFWTLFEKGLIYYGLKPVYWSPSSKTALAEAELEYKNIKSPSVYVRYEVDSSPFSEPLYLIVWTTTPWTLPLNQAVYCSPDVQYSVVKIPSFSGLYIIASDLIKDLEKKLKVEIAVHSAISSGDIIKLKYKHPWNKDKVLDIFESSGLKILGTGLLHSVPGHGHVDFVLGLANNLKLDCFVNEEGRYTSDAGAGLEGLDVLGRGSEYVIECLMPDIVLQEQYEHSYPFDWRTKEPVIIRASNQWFIDCEKLKDKAVKSLSKVQVPLKFFETKLQSRPYWCLSRQRKWGVPIPVFFHKTSKRPLISQSLMHHLSSLFASSGPDVWWTDDLPTLFPPKFCNEFFIKMEDVTKGNDIMDIWFDSGISWSFAINHKISEVYLEGADQYTGWFQSSLLTSVAVRGDAPFKKILTHGFVVDQNKKKMSKSLGNVVDPETVIKGEKAFGVDTLRWWVAHHSLNDLIPVSHNILQSEFDDVKKIRNTLRFCLGALNESTLQDLNANNFTYLDRYMLNSCYQFYHSIMKQYNSYNMYEVCFQTIYFITNKVSALYVNAIKDRLYCDEISSPRRRSCLYVINGILDTLCCTLAPILPHLIEEVYSYHPVHHGQNFFFKTKTWTPPESWNDSSTDALMDLVNTIKTDIYKTNEPGKLPQLHCVIKDTNNYNALKTLQNEDTSFNSELTELLQVSQVSLKLGEKDITYLPTDLSACLRCRRYTVEGGDELCKRCADVLG